MTINYREALGSDESLAIFLRNLARFDQQFTELLASKVDFTIRLEVHGNNGLLNHCRVYIDGFERPVGMEADIGRKSKKQ